MIKRWIRYAIALTVLTLIAFGIQYSYILNASLIAFSSQFKTLSATLFVEYSLSEQQHQQVIDTIQSARNRIEKVYGKPLARPIIIITDQSKTAFKYGLFDSPGIFFFMPWAQYLVLNFDLMNIDIAAHELVHAEIFHRIGYFNRLFELPTWFDEGAAMVVDYREKFSFDNDQSMRSEILRIKQVDDYKKFWGQSQEMTTRNYSAARVAVYQLFSDAGFTQLYPMLDKMKQGVPFDAAIQQLVTARKLD